MKSALAVVGLLVLVCALVNSQTLRSNISSWLGSCWNSTACADPVYDQQPYTGGYQRPVYPQQVSQQYNRNVVVNRVYAPPAPVLYRRPALVPLLRPFYRAY